MNPRLSKATTTPDTALTAEHAGWAAARAGKEAWIIDSGRAETKWFEYNCPENLEQMRHVRKRYCEKLREGSALWH